MITRLEGGLTYNQTFDAENRLISVAVGGQTTSFIYDGDGNLIKKINPNGSKTLYVGGIYEVDKASGGSVTRTVTYYPLAGAMRIDSTLYYVLKDHLGSSSVVTNNSGTIVGEQRYYPFGETRLTTGTIYTDKLFTGQREMAGLGIYHYQARFYSPKLGRFLSADTIVPSYANPQSLNRYSYVLNSPLNYIDPTGHAYCDFIDTSNAEDCAGGLANSQSSDVIWGSGNGGNGGGNNNEPDPSDGEPVEPNLGGGQPDITVITGSTCGSLGGYSPDCPGWHEYNVETVICPAMYQCTEEEIIDYMSRFAYPNQDPSRTAKPYYQYSVGIPILNIDLAEFGAIIFTTSNGGLTTTNTTLPTHILYDGRVDRTASQNSNGDWIVTTQGVGNNVYPGMNIANTIGGEMLFQIVDVQMAVYIATDQLFGGP
jgi:RHS repeat-associated protein